MKTPKTYRLLETTQILLDEMKKDMQWDETTVVEHAVFSMAVSLYGLDKVDKLMVNGLKK